MRGLTLQLVFALKAAFILYVLGGCAGCTPSPSVDSPQQPMNQPRLVLVYAPCTVNKSYLSPYNSDVTYTPQLDAFARSAVVFEKHRTEAGLSGIAYASIFTGHQASEHGVFAHPTTLSDSLYDITEAFTDNGYDTYFWNHQRMGAADLNYGQGVPAANVFKRMLNAEDHRLGQILQRLTTDKDYRACLMVNHRVNHNPYQAPHLATFLQQYPAEGEILHRISQEDFRKYMNLYYTHNFMLRYDFEQVSKEQNLSDQDIQNLAEVVELLYKSNIPVLDQLFGSVLAKIDEYGLKEDSLIAFTADHGESMFRSHASFKWSHGHALQSDVLDVPLIIRIPDSDVASRRIAHVSRSIDLFPTLSTLANLEMPDDLILGGYDFADAVRGQQLAPRLLAFSHTGMVMPNTDKRYELQESLGRYLARFYPAVDMEHTWVAVRDGDMVWKYRPRDNQTFEFQAFDVQADPGEANNIFDDQIPMHQEHAKKLPAYKEILVTAYREWLASPPAEQLGTEERLDRLRGLGYIK